MSDYNDMAIEIFGGWLPDVAREAFKSFPFFVLIGFAIYLLIGYVVSEIFFFNRYIVEQLILVSFFISLPQSLLNALGRGMTKANEIAREKLDNLSDKDYNKFNSSSESDEFEQFKKLIKYRRGQ